MPDTAITKEDISPMIKQRSHTISYHGSASPDRTAWSKKTSTTRSQEQRSGLLPSFVFLQLYHMGALHFSSLPTPIPEGNEDFVRGLKNLERIAPYETFKLLEIIKSTHHCVKAANIYTRLFLALSRPAAHLEQVGVVYVGEDQASNESAILSNRYGSKRYSQFLKRLGNLISLENCDPRDTFIGGLDHEEGEDGVYTYVWHDEIVQMVFHVATMMPTRDSDKKCNNKKRHIGNDYVTIVYNDSGEKYNMGTIKGQFNYVNIVVEPLDKVSSAVSLLCSEDMNPILEHVATKVVSEDHVADLVKQIALHSSMGSVICGRLKNNELFASNWLERLRQIKRMKEKTPVRRRTTDNESIITDFTEYV